MKKRSTPVFRSGVPVGLAATLSSLSLMGLMAACGNDPAFVNQETELQRDKPGAPVGGPRRGSDAVGAEVDGNAVVDAGARSDPGTTGSGAGDDAGADPGEGADPGSGADGGLGNGTSGMAGSAGGGAGSVGLGDGSPMPGGGAGGSTSTGQTSPVATPTPTPSPSPTPSNSSDGNLSDSEKAARDDAVTRVEASCATGTRVKTSVDIVFAKTAVDTRSICNWASNPTSDIIRGYFVQEVPVSLPAGALLCSSRLTSDASKTWVYDDEVVLTMNDVVLLSSQKDYLRRNDTNVMSRVGGGYGFEWANLEKLAYPNSHSVESDRYCYGGSDTKECVIPTSEVAGPVKLNLPSAALAPLAIKAQQDKKVEFKLWVTGDNDVTIDCKHSGITLKGEFEYVVP